MYQNNNTVFDKNHTFILYTHFKNIYKEKHFNVSKHIFHAACILLIFNYDM
jgi:hypothetical protein